MYNFSISHNNGRFILWQLEIKTPGEVILSCSYEKFAKYFQTALLYLKVTSNIVSGNFLFSSIWVFFHDHSRITGLQGKRESISLTPDYHFQPLHRHLHLSRAINAESSPLHVGSSRIRTWKPFVSERKSLTTKLRALNFSDLKF